MALLSFPARKETLVVTMSVTSETPQKPSTPWRGRGWRTENSALLAEVQNPPRDYRLPASQGYAGAPEHPQWQLSLQFNYGVTS